MNIFGIEIPFITSTTDLIVYIILGCSGLVVLLIIFLLRERKVDYNYQPTYQHKNKDSEVLQFLVDKVDELESRLDSMKPIENMSKHYVAVPEKMAEVVRVPEFITKEDPKVVVPTIVSLKRRVEHG
jgi:hypothetical protein